MYFFMRCLLVTVLSAHCSTIAVAKEPNWDFFGLPIAYQGTAIVFTDGQYSHSIDFQSHRDWASKTSYRDMTGVGVSVIDALIGTVSESWSFNPAAMSVSRSDRFGLTRQIAGENSYTPLSIARLIVYRSNEAVIESLTGNRSIIRLPDGVGKLRVTLVGNQIQGFEWLDANGKVVERVEYLAWTEIEEGVSVPSLVRKVAHVPQLPEPLSMEFRIEQIELLDAQATAPPVEIPSGFVVIDHLEGVTKDSDGNVISEILPGQVASGKELDEQVPRSVDRDSLVTTSSIVRMLIGGGAIIMVFALWIRFKAGTMGAG